MSYKLGLNLKLAILFKLKGVVAHLPFHNALIGGRYPYEMPQKRETYFLILWYVVVRN